MSNLYVVAPNIVASQYAQRRLKEVFGFQILRGNGEPHFSDRFVIVTPPERYKDDKPVICYSPPTMDWDGNITYEKNHQWIELIDALKLIAMIEPRISNPTYTTP